ncbi:PadR family transcriptional regulator [Streptomyces sp. NPDC088812]|uniref:PadR family transcriptional regulator n=1 Tax=Streptomyces sp. NPDC088812 TaxID=3365905 RepID=UPI0038208455
MSLRYALLALLTARPLTAYDMAKQFSASVGHVWHAPDSQIYPELRRMESDGLVEARELTSGGRRTKREYRITDDGLVEFRAWADTPLDYQRERDVHHLKAAYLEWADPAAAREQLQRHLTFHSEQLQQWLAQRDGVLDRSNPTLAARLENSPAEEHERVVAFKAFAYEGLIERARTEVAWARRGIDLLDRLSGTAAEAGGDVEERRA